MSAWLPGAGLRIVKLQKLPFPAVVVKIALEEDGCWTSALPGSHKQDHQIQNGSSAKTLLPTVNIGSEGVSGTPSSTAGILFIN